MANNQAQPFPTPPPFYKVFTPANVEQVQKLRKTASKDGTELDILALPAELRYLIPPEPPKGGEWRTFNETHHDPPLEPSLEAAGIEQLYPPTDEARLNPQPHLIALARSLLSSYLALTGVLSRNPEQFLGRVEDMQTILYNAHDLINSYRPHQARETLISLMEERIVKMREEIKKVQEEKQKVSGLMSTLMNRQGDDVKDETMQDVEHREHGGGHGHEMSMQKSAWAAIEEDSDAAGD